MEYKRGKGRGDVFKDRRILDQMISLRNKGIGASELARKYNVDHSTIIYHSKKNGVISKSQKYIDEEGNERIRPSVSISGHIIAVRLDDDGSPINLGKTYAEYLEIQEKKKWDRLLKYKT